MPCRFANSGTVATSRSASRAILALNVASNFLRDLVISVLHRLRQSRTLHTLTFGPISGVHFTVGWASTRSRAEKVDAMNIIGPPETGGGDEKLTSNPMDQSRVMAQLTNLRAAPRCCAKTRAGGACQ